MYLLLLLNLFYFSIISTTPNVRVISQHIVPAFLSGSGMALHDGTLYACGDDDPYLYALTIEGHVKDSFHIYKEQIQSQARISKSIKPDYEAIAWFESEKEKGLLIFGSGSKSPERDVITKITDPNGSANIKNYQVSGLYSHLKQTLHINQADFNLEGATIWQDEIVLLNRGDNALIKFPLKALLEYLNNGIVDKIKPQRFFFELEAIGGHTGTFSGATILEGTDKLMFSASVEVSDNAYNDGDILGSFVGFIDLGNLSVKTPKMYRVADDNDWFLGKIEAMELHNETSEYLIFSAITDDDNGSTGFLKIEYPKVLFN